MPDTDKDRYTRAYVAFQKEGNSDLEAMNRARAYVNFYRKQKKKKGLFDEEAKAPAVAASTRG